MNIYLCTVKDGERFQHTLFMTEQGLVTHSVPRIGETVFSFGHAYQVTDVIWNYDTESVHVISTPCSETHLEGCIFP